jgi:hypothetical protein
VVAHVEAGVALTALVPEKVTSTSLENRASNVPRSPTETVAKATTVPAKVLFAPKVAAVPIAQYTLAACAPLLNVTTAAAAVVKVVLI